MFCHYIFSRMILLNSQRGLGGPFLLLTTVLSNLEVRVSHCSEFYLLSHPPHKKKKKIKREHSMVEQCPCCLRLCVTSLFYSFDPCKCHLEKSLSLLELLQLRISDNSICSIKSAWISCSDLKSVETQGKIIQRAWRLTRLPFSIGSELKMSVGESVSMLYFINLLATY